MGKKDNNVWAYFFWYVFYFALFWLILGANMRSFWIVLIFYAISISFAFSRLAEELWRNVTGVRPLRLRKEKIRLLPLFEEVYADVIKADKHLSKEIKLYIKEDMDINAFAFGKETLVLTRGSIELLNDECLKGLIAHEFGHFSNYDTTTSLLMSVGNFYFSVLIAILERIKNFVDRKKKGSIVLILFKALLDCVYWIFRGIQFLSDFSLTVTRREQEYSADEFAVKSGFGEELAEVLNEIYSTSFSEPQSIKEQLKSTHPPITIRIERVENAVYS